MDGLAAAAADRGPTAPSTRRRRARGGGAAPTARAWWRGRRVPLGGIRPRRRRRPRPISSRRVITAGVQRTNPVTHSVQRGARGWLSQPAGGRPCARWICGPVPHSVRGGAPPTAHAPAKTLLVHGPTAWPLSRLADDRCRVDSVPAAYSGRLTDARHPCARGTAAAGRRPSPPPPPLSWQPRPVAAPLVGGAPSPAGKRASRGGQCRTGPVVDRRARRARGGGEWAFRRAEPPRLADAAPPPCGAWR